MLVLELIVGFERVRTHRHISVTHVRGHDDRYGRLATLLLALALEREAHGVGVRHIAQQRLENGILQRRGAVAFEQPRQGRGDGTEIGAAFGGAHEQGLAGGSGLREAVIGAVLTGGTLVVEQSLDVGGLFDLRLLVVTTRMAPSRARANRSGLVSGRLAGPRGLFRLDELSQQSNQFCAPKWFLQDVSLITAMKFGNAACKLQVGPTVA